MGVGPSEYPPDALMMHTSQYAMNFAHQHHGNKQKYQDTIEQMGKQLNFQNDLIDNSPGAGNDIKQIEIEGVQYQLIKFISHGGFAKVYKAQDHKHNRIVAMKIMHNLSSIQKDIKNEIHFLRLIKKIDIDTHPVIEFYGCKFTKDKIFITMELATTDLLTFWFNNAVHREAQHKFMLGIIIIIYVLRALIFLEKLNIIHGDIKPQNLVIVQNHRQFSVKIIDFGTVEKMNTKAAQITVKANKIHTVYFASPEFLHRNGHNGKSRHLHKRSDAWAAGVMFYVLFFEKFPWQNELEYVHFCNNSHAKDILIPRESGYKTIIEPLLKKNPDERASAKATYLQMKEHSPLGMMIKIFQEKFCSVDDVCSMKVSNEIRQELSKIYREEFLEDYHRRLFSGKLLRSGHSTHGANAVKTPGSRQPCRYGQECYNLNFDHRKEFSHPGDLDYHVGGGGDANGHFEKPKCPYGFECYNFDLEHRKKYVHPDISNHHHHHLGKIMCPFGKGCYDKTYDHLIKYSHPDDLIKEKCRYGNNCYKAHDPEHMARFWH